MEEAKVKVLCCKECGDEYPKPCLSRRGLCADCGMARMREAAKQIRNKEGPIYQLYHRNVRLARARRGIARGGQGD